MKITTKEITLVALFAGLTAIGAFISLPIGPVPITLQTLFVILGGIILGPKLGALAQIVYIGLGLIGIPIFSGFTGGPQSVLKPSFGFLIGFIFAAFIVGKIVNINSQCTMHNAQFTIRVWVASIVGTIVIYLFGVPYMYYILNVVMSKELSLDAILKMGFWAFLPGDIVKLIITSIVGIKVLPIVNKTK